MPTCIHDNPVDRHVVNQMKIAEVFPDLARDYLER